MLKTTKLVEGSGIAIRKLDAEFPIERARREGTRPRGRGSQSKGLDRKGEEDIHEYKEQKVVGLG